MGSAFVVMMFCFHLGSLRCQAHTKLWYVWVHFSRNSITHIILACRILMYLNYNSFHYKNKLVIILSIIDVNKCQQEDYVNRVMFTNTDFVDIWSRCLSKCLVIATHPKQILMRCNSYSIQPVDVHEGG